MVQNDNVVGIDEADSANKVDGGEVLPEAKDDPGNCIGKTHTAAQPT